MTVLSFFYFKCDPKDQQQVQHVVFGQFPDFQFSRMIFIFKGFCVLSDHERTQILLRCYILGTNSALMVLNGERGGLKCVPLNRELFWTVEVRRKVHILKADVVKDISVCVSVTAAAAGR